MKFSAVAVLAAIAGANAYSNVTYTTEVVTAYTTYCPEATQITYGGSTYTITEATTLTITNCPCTVTKPITTVSSASAIPYSNSTLTTATVAKTTAATKTSVGTTSATVTKASATAAVTAGAGKAAALSGAGLAGVMGIAALFL